MQLILVFATLLLFAVLLSSLAKRSVLSAAVLFLVAGFVSGPAVLDLVVTNETVVQRFAEVALFAVLFTDGMHITAGGLRRAWRLPGRALIIGLPFTLALVALLARYVVGVPWTAAWLLGAALSPTDPVLAAAMIGQEKVPLRLRELLNVESGLNDGLAVPIVMGLLAVNGAAATPALTAVGQAALGVAIGIAVPWLAVRLSRARIFDVSDESAPMGAFAVALLVFSIAGLVHANEFLGSFAAGVTLASQTRRGTEAFQPLGLPLAEIVKLAALLLFGALITPDLLTNLGPGAYIFAALVLFVARPMGIFVSLVGTDLGRRETVAVGWFGPKGFASVFFAFLIVHSGIAEAQWLFSLLALVITASIVAHSSTDILVARWFVEAERDSVAAGREVAQSGN